MFEVTIDRTADGVIAECLRRGLVVKLETTNKKPLGRHWHLGFQGRPGVLELTDAGGVVSLKVATNRDGGWATDLAQELARS